MNKSLSKKLTALGKRDQTEARRGLAAGEFDDKVFRENTLVLKKIVLTHGWPSIDLVGKRASRYAWLLVQHADHDLSFQKKCLGLMQDIYTKNNKHLDPANIAYLTDRILVNQNKKQLFGTQCYFRRDGKFVVRPIRDLKTLDQRRKAYNLETFKEFTALVKKYPPPNPAAQKSQAKDI